MANRVGNTGASKKKTMMPSAMGAFPLGSTIVKIEQTVAPVAQIARRMRGGNPKKQRPAARNLEKEKIPWPMQRRLKASLRRDLITSLVSIYNALLAVRTIAPTLDEPE